MFFGLRVGSRLVLRGTPEGKLPHSKGANGRSRIEHTIPNVYGSMLLQVVRDYAGIGDFRTLTMAEIRFFYSGLKPELRKALEPPKK